MIHELLAAHLGLGPGSGIRLLDCPFDAVPVQEAPWWHPVHTHDAGHLWLRGLADLVGARSAARARASAEEIRGARPTRDAAAALSPRPRSRPLRREQPLEERAVSAQALPQVLGGDLAAAHPAVFEVGALGGEHRG